MVWYELPNSVAENGMSFHSTHATSHALHPMHVVVSISFATVNCRCVSSPGTLPAWPLIFCTRSVAWLIAVLPGSCSGRSLDRFLSLALVVARSDRSQLSFLAAATLSPTLREIP